MEKRPSLNKAGAIKSAVYSLTLGALLFQSVQDKERKLVYTAQTDTRGHIQRVVTETISPLKKSIFLEPEEKYAVMKLFFAEQHMAFDGLDHTNEVVRQIRIGGISYLNVPFRIFECAEEHQPNSSSLRFTIALYPRPGEEKVFQYSAPLIVD